MYLRITVAFLLMLQAPAAEADKLWENGLKAYGNKDYVEALKLLYAYRTINEKALRDQKPDILEQIDERIRVSEKMLRAPPPQTLSLFGSERRRAECACGGGVPILPTISAPKPLPTIKITFRSQGMEEQPLMRVAPVMDFNLSSFGPRQLTEGPLGDPDVSYGQSEALGCLRAFGRSRKTHLLDSSQLIELNINDSSEVDAINRLLKVNGLRLQPTDRSK